VSTINILIGYGYHPVTTATYLQRSLERRADVIFIGTPWAGRPGFAATGHLREIVADLPAKPDLYLHVDSGAAWYFPRGLTDLECPTACYLIDVHVQPKLHLKQAMFFDYAFTAQRDFVDVLRREGHPQVYWLPLACDLEIHRRYDVPKRFDVGFVGATGGAYVRRTALLQQLARRYTMNDYQLAYRPSEMARVYSESYLVFNCSLRGEVNMRVFEGPATGSLLLTDRIGNGLSELVGDREHVVMYDDEHVLELVAEYLRDSAARERIARTGYEHVRTHHTYDHRVSTLLDVVFASGAGPCLGAPLRRYSSPDVQLAYAKIFSRARRIDDTIEQFKNVPLRYRFPAATQFVLCLLRQIRDG
jgi:glycosyltransferase involved in cell wall biosynthesis